MAECLPPARSPLETELARFLDELDSPAGRIIVAVSGGPDSTALLHALSNLADRRREVAAVHVNHRLRGEASEADAAWITSFCSKLGVSLAVLDGTLDDNSILRIGVEATARAVRYRLLSLERERINADFIATAHTRSDQAETVLLRLITGRGTWRLSGIQPTTVDRVIRPILRVSRSDVEGYLDDHGIIARVDHSNADSRFLRNRIRNELLPLIASWNPRIEELLADTAELERDRAAAFDDLIEPVKARLVRRSETSAVLDLDATLSPHIIRDLALEEIRRLDPHAREVDADALKAITETRDGDSRIISPRLRASREGDTIVLRLLETDVDPTPFSVRLSPGETVVIPEAGYVLSLVEAMPGASLVAEDGFRQVIQLPDHMAPEFEIRNRRPGDRFRPLGMDRDKNLADFMIDRRIPNEDRDSLPLLVCKGSIAWVTGVEVAEEFKVRSTDGTRLEIVAERIGGDR